MVVARLRRQRKYVNRCALGSPALATTTAVHAAVTDTGSPQTITTGITQPDCGRNVTATSGGTAGDIGAVTVTINGTDVNNRVLHETLPAFTADSATTVVGTKAFRSITSIEIPAHDGTGATTAIGVGSLLGLPETLAENLVLATFLNGAREPLDSEAVTISDSTLALNTVQLDSALDGSEVVVVYLGR